MRLIDADALEPDADYDDGDYWAVSMAQIQNAPTIEPRTGKWIPVMNGRGGHCCNRCNGYAPSYANGDEHLSDFCPNCGARMEAEG